HGREPLRLAEALERHDLGALGGDRGGQAGPARLAVDQHGARPAAALLATGLRARELELVPQNVEERRERRAHDVLLEAGRLELHADSSSRARARPTTTGSILARYHAVASASSPGVTSFSASSGLPVASTDRPRAAARPG